MRRELEYELFSGPWDGLSFESEAEAELERLLERIDEAVYETKSTTCTTAPVSSDGFGLALRWYTNTLCVPNEVGQFLQQSPTFMDMVGKLDKKYLSLNGPETSSWEKSAKPGEMKLWTWDWKPRDDGVLTAGPFIGRRVLEVRWSSTGSYFSPAGSPEHPFGPWDIIFLQPVSHPNSTIEIGQWIEHIAHETTHAFHYIFRSGPSPAKMADRIRAAIAEEGDTRRTEAKIVAEIKKSVPKLKTFQAQRQCVDPSCRSLVDANDGAAVVERDLFPSELRRTYLEQFVMMERISEAIQREKLSQQEMDRRNKAINRIPLGGGMDHYLNTSKPIFYNRWWVGPYFISQPSYNPQMRSPRPITSEYSKLRFWLRVIDGRWRRFLNQNSPQSQNFEAAKERILQEHARAFFGGVIGYTPRP